MKKNVGQLDRNIRLIAGILILSLFFFLEGPIRWISLLGIILILTSIIRVCPIYLPFGINTRKDK